MEVGGRIEEEEQQRFEASSGLTFKLSFGFPEDRMSEWVSDESISIGRRLMRRKAVSQERLNDVGGSRSAGWDAYKQSRWR